MTLRLDKRFWTITTGIILVFTVFVVGRNLLHAVKIRRQIGVLERERTRYLEKIARDSTLIEQLRYDDYLEQYAREHYHMQRRGEHEIGRASCRERV